MGGTTRKFAVARLAIPTAWSIQENINLTQKKITTLENHGFPLIACIETMFKLYLASNFLVQAIPMCLL